MKSLLKVKLLMKILFFPPLRVFFTRNEMSWEAVGEKHTTAAGVCSFYELNFNKISLIATDCFKNQST